MPIVGGEMAGGAAQRALGALQTERDREDRERDRQASIAQAGISASGQMGAAKMQAESVKWGLEEQGRRRQADIQMKKDELESQDRWHSENAALTREQSRLGREHDQLMQQGLFGEAEKIRVQQRQAAAAVDRRGRVTQLMSHLFAQANIRRDERTIQGGERIVNEHRKKEEASTKLATLLTKTQKTALFDLSDEALSEIAEKYGMKAALGGYVRPVPSKTLLGAIWGSGGTVGTEDDLRTLLSQSGVLESGVFDRMTKALAILEGGRVPSKEQMPSFADARKYFGAMRAVEEWGVEKLGAAGTTPPVRELALRVSQLGGSTRDRWIPYSWEGKLPWDRMALGLVGEEETLAGMMERWKNETGLSYDDAAITKAREEFRAAQQLPPGVGDPGDLRMYEKAEKLAESYVPALPPLRR